MKNGKKERPCQIGRSVNVEVKRRDKLGKKLQEVNESRSALTYRLEWVLHRPPPIK